MNDRKARDAAMWGSGPYERIARTLVVMHDDLVRRLAPGPGERWLDVATGTGDVAMRAARAGAAVTGIDIAPALIDTAERRAAHDGLEIRYLVGDAERLPFPDASFDTVASAVGVIFASDQRTAAQELVRVCRCGGRLGLTAWCRDGGVGDFFDVMASFRDEAGDGGSPFEWGLREYVVELLGDGFALAFHEGDAPYRPESGEAAWSELSSSYGPTKTLAESLDSERRGELRRAVVEFYEDCRSERGLCHSRRYLLVLGVRR